MVVTARALFLRAAKPLACSFHAAFGGHGQLGGQNALYTELLLLCGSVLHRVGVEEVSHERLVSPAFDPLSGFETQRLRINQRYPQNRLEQIIVFTAGLFGLAS